MLMTDSSTFCDHELFLGDLMPADDCAVPYFSYEATSCMTPVTLIALTNATAFQVCDARYSARIQPYHQPQKELDVAIDARSARH